MSDASDDLPLFIDSEDKLNRALSYWKNYTFQPQYINVRHAAETIMTDRRPVEARHEYTPRWVVSQLTSLISAFPAHILKLVPRGQKKMARFYTAGIWRWNSNLDTGNYVPAGETPPARLAESRM